MNEHRIKNLLINCEKRGGLVSHRRLSNGDDKPYELNIIMECNGRPIEIQIDSLERFIRLSY